ncbi:type I-C CRISPR-associated protein Cas8c/Csd1 [uncultured Desulfosarcina sp.]|uniref:type I-C CRISPR-associated protein Cas8c/Csd1 n=1 Tax=uncultured Desulfosarcina sp. TaxID=218289 RepID=UPI0029C624CC|nr:type I-C CRISPR-associated protein Cas8c/Csd1 [uncultured Desulfosarcina sp.]
MSWMAKLYQTYNNIAKLQNYNEHNILWPIAHFVKNAHLEIVIDIEGTYLKGRTKTLQGEEGPTLIPASEASAGRSGSKIAPHPLCDEIGYCAFDYPNADQEKVAAYMTQLEDWANSSWSHPKVMAVLKYLLKKNLWKDLSGEIEFPVKIEKLGGNSQKIETSKVFIRWRIEKPGELDSTTWMDNDLINAWIDYDRDRNSKEGFCYILGKNERRASNHPRFLRWPGDGAKLISSNDHSGFTFRGRFTDSKTMIDRNGAQAVCVGFDVTQKAHNALRWLLSGQKCFHNDEQVFVCWAVSCKDSPDPFKASWELFLADPEFNDTPADEPEDPRIDHAIDIGGSFAIKLRKYLAGYHATLDVNEQIIIMGLDSATPGRMGIIYYRELLASEFLDRIEAWHRQFAWPQRHTQVLSDPKGKKKPVRETIWPVSSPAPRLIAEAAYGDILKSNDTLKKSVIERILPCIVDGRPFPRDILASAVRRAANRNIGEKWEWERNLAVACALYKGFYLRHPQENERREYSMSLEEDWTSRDYLYGRLLALAERIEETALRIGGEERPTTAARLMQRFADRPFSTWRNIELALQPYMQRLQANRAGFLFNRKKELDAVQALFSHSDFVSDKTLSGEFLLGYHCQKQAWVDKTADVKDEKEEKHES